MKQHFITPGSQYQIHLHKYVYQATWAHGSVLCLWLDVHFTRKSKQKKGSQTNNSHGNGVMTTVGVANGCCYDMCVLCVRLTMPTMCCWLYFTHSVSQFIFFIGTSTKREHAAFDVYFHVSLHMIVHQKGTQTRLWTEIGSTMLILETVSMGCV